MSVFSNAKYKDEIIKLLCEGNGPYDIANKLEIKQTFVILCIREIENDFPDALFEFMGSGNDQINVGIVAGQLDRLLDFVEDGGYQTIDQKRQENNERANYKKNLEIESLKSAIKAAEQSAKEARRATRAAWFSAIIGLLTLALSAYITFKGSH